MSEHQYSPHVSASVSVMNMCLCLSGFNVHICVCKYGKLWIRTVYTKPIYMYCTRCISSMYRLIHIHNIWYIWGGGVFILWGIIIYRSAKHLPARVYHACNINYIQSRLYTHHPCKGMSIFIYIYDCHGPHCTETVCNMHCLSAQFPNDHHTFTHH